jgi:hypothetical protein
MILPRYLPKQGSGTGGHTGGWFGPSQNKMEPLTTSKTATIMVLAIVLFIFFLLVID